MTDLPMRSRATALIRNGRWGQWISRGGWTLFDRGLFALSNFGLNVVLARWMSPADYGAFAIAFSIFLVIGSAQSTIVVGPLLVFGPRRYKERYRAYLGLVIKIQFLLSLVISLGLAAAGVGLLMAGSRDTGLVFFALAVSGPFILVLWLLRTSNYARIQSKGAAISGLIYLILLIAASYGFFQAGILTPSSALYLMGAASLLVAIQLMISQKVDLKTEKVRSAFAREIVLEHFRFARWTLPAQLLIAMRTNLFFFVLPIWSSLQEAGALRALMNLVMPLAFMQNSLQVISVPVLVRARGNRTFVEKLIVGIGFFFLNAATYALLLIIFRDQVVELLYGDRYQGYGLLVILIALLPVANSAGLVLGSALRALERPKAVLLTAISSTVCAVVIGLPLIAVAGANGAVTALLISSLAMLASMVWHTRAGIRADATAAASAGQPARTAREAEANDEADGFGR